MCPNLTIPRFLWKAMILEPTSPHENMPWDSAIDMHTEVQKMEAQYPGYANQYYKFEIYFDAWALLRPLLPASIPIQRHANCHAK